MKFWQNSAGKKVNCLLTNSVEMYEAMITQKSPSNQQPEQKQILYGELFHPHANSTLHKILQINSKYDRTFKRFFL